MKYTFPLFVTVLFMLLLPPAYAAPTTPANLEYSTNNINYINWSWVAGNDTDSYNISNNNIWYNGTTDTYFNITGVGQLSISSISVYAYNSTTGLSAPVEGYYQIPLNQDDIKTEIQALWGGMLLSGIFVIAWLRRKLNQYSYDDEQY